MTIDFEKKQMSLMYNDQDIGVAFTDIPDEIVPAISSSGPIELRCTKYELS